MTTIAPREDRRPTETRRPRLARVLREVAKFAAVGGAGTAVNFLVFNLCLHYLGLYTVRASVIATLVAIATNYLGYRFWVYRDRDRSARAREITLFLVFSAVGLLIENGVLYATHYWIGWQTPLEDNVFKFVGMGVATVFRFASYRTWVFRALAPEPRPAAEPGAVSSAEGPGDPAQRRPGPRPEAARRARAAD